MQTVETNKENENPQHFPSTDSTTAKEIDETLHKSTPTDNSNPGTTTAPCTSESASVVTPRPKFSFAADYTPSSHFTPLLASTDLPSTYPFEPQYPLSVSSFTVLNNDLGGSSVYSKPNAIVHPIRRSEESALPNNCNALERELRITGYPAPGGLSVTHPQYGKDVRYFAEELNRKLSSLNTSRGSEEFGSNRLKISSQNVNNQETLNQRPLFITTVPRGVFLPPPKEVILDSPSRKRQLYAYSSHPVVYNATTATSSFYDHHHYHHHHHHPHSHNTIDHQTHASHKVKVLSPHQHQHNQRSSSTAIAKDKPQNGRTAVGGTAARTVYADGGSGGGADGNPTSSANSARPNESKGSCTSPPTKKSAAMLGGINVSKQQFKQQLQQSRSKREAPSIEPYRNVMHDKRVIRGSNYGGNPLLGDYDPFDKAAEFRRRQALRKKNVSNKNQRNVLGTPPPVSGRRHEDVQTERYLEELVAKPPEFSVETQTDLFLEKPPTPPYIPAKIGVDVATEILDGELFQFDAEAQGIIDVLVDSTIEMSILEVAHEQEMELIRKRQAELLAQREAELAELRRLEEEEARLAAEKERRLRQDDIAKSLDSEMQKDVTAAKLLQGHIASILPEILENLEPATDAAKKDKLMQSLCPWLSAEVAKEVGHIVDSREILTVIIQEIIKQRAEIYADYKEDELTSHIAHGEEEETAQEVFATETEDEHSAQCPPDV